MAENTPGEVPQPAPSRPAPAFEVSPYRPEGGFSQMGSLLAIGLSLVGGLVLGFAAWFISQWFYLVLLFPIAIGAALGGLGRVGVRVGKVRSPLMAGLAGFCGGCVAMIGMQYFEYRQFLRERDQHVPAQLRAMVLQMDKNAPLPQDPDAAAFVEGLRVSSFIDYVDLSARQGVEIKRAKGGGKDKGMNLGYYGSYIYWGVELLIVAGIAFAMTRTAAGEPYCTACNSWKPERAIGTFNHAADHCTRALSEGTLTRLTEPPAAGSPIETLLLAAAVCPHCQSQAPVDVKLQRVSVNSKGERNVAQLAQVTYPGEALTALETLFQTASETPREPPPPDAKA